jgi:hypothetical protein
MSAEREAVRTLLDAVEVLAHHVDGGPPLPDNWTTLLSAAFNQHRFELLDEDEDERGA